MMNMYRYKCMFPQPAVEGTGSLGTGVTDD